ncbi:hypothetical protein D3C85_1289010 [compost metagenome]
MVQRRQVFAQLAFRTLRRLLDLVAAFLQLEADGHARQVLLLQLVAEAGKLIDPGLDTKDVTALLHHMELAPPAIIAQAGHDLGLPGLVAIGTPAHPHGQLIVAIGKHLAGHHHVLPRHGLDGKLPAIEGRHGVFDRDARQQQSLRQRHMRVVVELCRFFSSHRASLLYAPWTLLCLVAIRARPSAPE